MGGLGGGVGGGEGGGGMRFCLAEIWPAERSFTDSIAMFGSTLTQFLHINAMRSEAAVSPAFP